MKKILITGAGGYIGSVATYLFLKNGYRVVALDNFATGYKQPLNYLQKQFGKDSLKIFELDLSSNLESIFANEKDIEIVVHYAASCVVDESMKNPQKYFTNNVCGTQNLLAFMLKFNMNKVVLSSTCAVYGDAEYTPLDEKHPINPNNPYGESKRIVEQIIDWYGRLNNLKYIVLRYFNVAGATENGEIGYSKKPATHLIENAVRGVLGIEQFYLTCPKVDTPDKSPIRDFVNVLDLANAHLKAVNYLLNNGNSEIINLGTGNGNSVYEIIKIIERILNVHIICKRRQPREGEAPILIADIRKAKRVLGWSPQKSIEESIKSTVYWFKKHPQGWEN